MWLTLDIGNSAAKGGLFDGAVPKHIFRIDLERDALHGEEATAKWTHVLREKIGTASIERVGMASVVPSVMPAAQAALRAITGIEPVRIQPSMDLPFDLAYETPDTLGDDRLAAAVAAWMLYGEASNPPRSTIAIDAGTAVTYEVVTHHGVYEGGIIAPSLSLMRRAMRHGTEQLPAVSLDDPPQDVVGRSTEQAIQSGLHYGFIDAIAGLLDRITGTLDTDPVVVLTGGGRERIGSEIDAIDYRNAHLVLHGIRLLLRLNAPS